MYRVGAREYCNSYLFYFEFLLKSHTFSHTIPPPLTTQRARASAILTQISGNDLTNRRATDIRELKNHDESHDDDVYRPLKDWSDDVSFGGKKES